jgi:hypothetical protein
VFNLFYASREFIIVLVMCNSWLTLIVHLVRKKIIYCLYRRYKLSISGLTDLSQQESVFSLQYICCFLQYKQLLCILLSTMSPYSNSVWKK